MTGFIEIPITEKTWLERLALDAGKRCIKLNRPFLTGIEHDDKQAYLMRVSCKMWNCPACSARNAKRWIARVIHHINTNDNENGWQMFTLTAHEKWRSDNSSVKNLRQGWKKLYNRLRYTYGVSNYTKVWEMHEKSGFHLHGLIDSIVDMRWLKDNARECGMGYQVEIHEVDNAGQVAGYIAKYFLKSEHERAERQFPRGLRRIECSRTWLKLPEIKHEVVFAWIINQTREGQLRQGQYYHNKGFEVIDTVKEV